MTFGTVILARRPSVLNELLYKCMWLDFVGSAEACITVHEARVVRSPIRGAERLQVIRGMDRAQKRAFMIDFQF